MRSHGTLIQDAPTNPTPVPSRPTLDRFADVAAYANSAMPSVRVGETYQIAGTETEVVALCFDAGQVALLNAHENTLAWVARRDLNESLTHIGPADTDVLTPGNRLSLLARALKTPIDQHTLTLADGLVDLLGPDEAHEYLLTLTDIDFAITESGPWSLDTLLAGARLWQAEQADEADDAQHVELTFGSGFWPTT